MTILLIIGVVIALLITIALPIAAGFWLNKKLGIAWQVIMYGALGYFLVQAINVLIFNGFTNLLQNGTIILSDQAVLILNVTLSVLLGALFGVLVRWAGMKYLKEDLTNLEAAYGLGLGYGGAESIMLVGLPLLMTFITMLTNIDIDQATTTLEPEIVGQIQALWEVPFYLPLAGSLERIAALVMHITVTILVLQVFLRKNYWYLAAAAGVEVLINGLVVGLSEAGVMFGWVILISVVLMVGNFYILYRINAFEIDLAKQTADPLGDSSNSRFTPGD